MAADYTKGRGYVLVAYTTAEQLGREPEKSLINGLYLPILEIIPIFSIVHPISDRF